MSTRAAVRTEQLTPTGQTVGWFYAAAAALGAATLATLLNWYPHEDVSEAIGKFVSTGTAIGSLLCLAALWQREPTQKLAAAAIAIGAFGVAWAASFTALPDPPAGLGDPQNDLRMVAAGFAAGGALGLLFTVLRGPQDRQWAHVPLILVLGFLAIGSAITLITTAPAAFGLDL